MTKHRNSVPALTNKLSLLLAPFGPLDGAAAIGMPQITHQDIARATGVS
jgi:hypothetical protein